MNIAFSSLLLLLLFLPGIIFRITIIKADSFENPLDTSRIAELVFVLLPTIILHALGYYLLEKHMNYDVSLEQLYYLLIGNSKAIEELEFLSIIEPSFLDFLKYLLCTCLVSGAIAWLLKLFILKFYLDLKFPSFFGISNEWYNLLSGRSYCFEKKRELKSDRKQYLKQTSLCNRFTKYSRKRKLAYKRLLSNVKVDFIDVDVLVNFGSKNIIYRGELFDFFLAKGNSIDKIYLRSPFKREFSADQEDFQSIDSDSLVIKNENIVNLNVRMVLLS